MPKFKKISITPLKQCAWHTLNYPRLKNKYNLKTDVINLFLEKIINAGKTVKLPAGKEIIIKEDPADDKFLILARHEKADYLVSGDTHLLSRKAFGKTRIVTPAEFLETLNRKI